MPEICPVCESALAVPTLTSALGGHSICRDCSKHHAERPLDLHNAALAANTPQRLDDLRMILKRATCFAGDAGYLSLADYHKRMKEQALVIKSQRSKDDLNEQLARRMRIKLKRRENADMRQLMEVMKRVIPDQAFYNPFVRQPLWMFAR